MELKSYQQDVIKDLERYLVHLQKNKGNYSQAFVDFWDQHPHFPKTEMYQNNLKNCPHICLKVPTAGGKTFIACHALQSIFNGLQIQSDRMVVWLVPSQAIFEQTYKNLNNPKHFYRQKLQQHFGSRINVYDIEQLLQASNGFNPLGIKENVNILVLTYQSIRADKQTKETRRFFKENSRLSPFFEGNTDKSFLLNENEIDEISLINVIRKYNPICIIDEAHNATSDLSVEMLQNIKPCFVLELTATPRKIKKGKKEIEISNIVSFVNSFALKQENMVKLPLLVQNLKDKNEVLRRAIALQKELELRTKKINDYIRPIVLCQAQAQHKDDSETFEKIKGSLLALGIAESHIAIKISNKDEIKNVDLLAKNCPIRYIITVDALKEGWDCPFAYILATVANKSSEIAIEQIVGRVLRKPYTKAQNDHYLNMSYVLTSSSKFQEVLDKIVLALNHQGFSEKDVQILKNVAPALVLTNPASNLIQENTVSENAEDRDQSAENQVLVENLLQQSDQIYQADQAESAQILASGQKPIPEELKSKVQLYGMKTVFKEVAKNILLPQFFIKTPKMSMFGSQEEAKLSVEFLLKGFNLSKQSIDIPFAQIEIDLYEIDLEFGESESNFARAKANKTMQEEFLKLFQASSPEQKIKIVSRKIAENIGSLPPFDEKELRLYFDRLVESFDPERLNHAAMQAREYAEKIKKFIQELGTKHCEPKFYELIDQEKIYTKPSFKFPDHSTAKENSTIIKNLYDRVENINGLEKPFISEIASLDNVLFWHKFGNRGENNMSINGCFMNHYPDFLIVCKSGKKILAETKGDQLSNEETAKKVKLGKKWAELAGREFGYHMIYKDKKVENCQTFESFKTIISEL